MTPRTLINAGRKVTPARDRARIRRPRRAGGRPRAAGSGRSPGPARGRRGRCAAGCADRGRSSARPRRTADRPRPRRSRGCAPPRPGASAQAGCARPLPARPAGVGISAVGVVERQAPEQAQDRRRQRRLLGDQIRRCRAGRPASTLMPPRSRRTSSGSSATARCTRAGEIRLRHLERQRERLRRRPRWRRRGGARPPRRRPAAPRSARGGRARGRDRASPPAPSRTSGGPPRNGTARTARRRARRSAAAKCGDAFSAASIRRSASTARPRSISACPSSSASRATRSRSRRAHVAAAPARVLQAQRRPIDRRRQLVDVQVGRRLQRLGIVGRQRQRQRDRVARLVQAVEPHQRDGAVVVRLDRARRLAGRLLGAGERARVVAVVEQLGGAVEQRARPARPARPGRSAKQRRSGRGGGSVVSAAAVPRTRGRTGGRRRRLRVRGRRRLVCCAGTAAVRDGSHRRPASARPATAGEQGGGVSLTAPHDTRA